jgi:DNA polymerase gamma 1
MILRLNKSSLLSSRSNQLRINRKLSISIQSRSDGTESSEKKENAGVRLNQVNVQMINEKLRSYLFDHKNPDDAELIRKAQENLKKFSLGSGDIQAMKDFGDRLELPKLRGKNLSEHFYKIGREQTEVYLKLLSKFGNNNLNDKLKLPKEFVFKPGWTR